MICWPIEKRERMCENFCSMISKRLLNILEFLPYIRNQTWPRRALGVGARKTLALCALFLEVREWAQKDFCFELGRFAKYLQTLQHYWLLTNKLKRKYMTNMTKRKNSWSTSGKKLHLFFFISMLDTKVKNLKLQWKS